MNADSKKRQEAIKKLKSRLPSLPIGTLEKLARIPNNWEFPDEVTNIPTKEDEEIKKFRLCFEYLNWDTCVLKQFDDSRAKALLETFEKVSKCEVKRLPELRIVRDKITNVSPYESLFAYLSPDVELLETELSGEGRIFFFIVGHKFNIVSVETLHR